MGIDYETTSSVAFDIFPMRDIAKEVKIIRELYEAELGERNPRIVRVTEAPDPWSIQRFLELTEKAISQPGVGSLHLISLM